MRLTTVSPGILINADHICSIEQRNVQGVDEIIIYLVNGKEYYLQVPLDNFMKDIFVDMGDKKQYFAG